MIVIAFSPGHITAFFKIIFNTNKKIIGSVGAGLCINQGSYAVAQDGVKYLSLGGNIGKGEVTRTALSYLKTTGMYIKITNNLPFSQGFGISASSSLAAALAAVKITQRSHQDALKAAYKAELLHRTGLGDATTAFLGGVELRKTAGLNAIIEKKTVKKRLLIAIVDKKISTSEILNDTQKIQAINKAYQHAHDDYNSSLDLEHLFEIAYRFSLDSNLANSFMRQILCDANKIGHATMCMLGGSIVSIHTPEMKQFLSKYKLYECTVDNEGARILASFFP